MNPPKEPRQFWLVHRYISGELICWKTNFSANELLQQKSDNLEYHAVDFAAYQAAQDKIAELEKQACEWNELSIKDYTKAKLLQECLDLAKTELVKIKEYFCACSIDDEIIPQVVAHDALQQIESRLKGQGT